MKLALQIAAGIILGSSVIGIAGFMINLWLIQQAAEGLKEVMDKDIEAMQKVQVEQQERYRKIQIEQQEKIRAQRLIALEKQRQKEALIQHQANQKRMHELQNAQIQYEYAKKQERERELLNKFDQDYKAANDCINPEENMFAKCANEKRQAKIKFMYENGIETNPTYQSVTNR